MFTALFTGVYPYVDIRIIEWVTGRLWQLLMGGSHGNSTTRSRLPPLLGYYDRPRRGCGCLYSILMIFLLYWLLSLLFTRSHSGISRQ